MIGRLGLLGTAAAALGLAFLNLLDAMLVEAAHPRSTTAHTYTMHSSDAFSDEDYCVDDVSPGGVITDAEASFEFRTR